MIPKSLTPKEFFEKFHKDTMHLVDEFYDEEIVFQDPLVEIKNRGDLKEYYAGMYKNVTSISWSFADEIREGDRCTLVWRMRLVAQSLNANKPLDLDGVSVIKFGGKEGKAIYHRDYFDMGAFVYEGLPILGSMVRVVKGKMAGHHKKRENA